ncbi:hypothetical protein N7462_006858 [Penicillium macrosclerotiorum]|uniref:uncharacterized protein n=1 Tax=Penicillium macrosclerotiorum TaxID=303699 RepID=UPI002548579D|nr:uncharacterized protein N7462_006858 [Penicillium macrosclerotiorum]KAJ5678614.1 hypothetical protein N7462_006858 [Penicillium macrosclerotiorum]
MAAWPTNAVAQRMANGPESVANGGWMAAVSTIFAIPGVILAPELVQTAQGVRLDFAAVNVATGYPFFAFEGKGPNYNWDNLAGEVQQSCDGLRPNAFQGYTYGLGGSGRGCIFLEYDGAQSRYLTVNGGGVVGRQQHRQVFDIVNDQWAISRILTVIVGLTRYHGGTVRIQP